MAKDRDLVSAKAGASHDFVKNPVISGYLRQVDQNAGEFRSTRYTIEKETGERIAVWGNRVMDDQLQSLPLNTYVVIEFLGMQKTKQGNREFKNYAVSFDRSTVVTNAEGERLPY